MTAARIYFGMLEGKESVAWSNTDTVVFLTCAGKMSDSNLSC